MVRYHELAAQFKAIGGAAFRFHACLVLAGYIAYSIAEKPGLVAGFVAGAIANASGAYGHIVVCVKVPGLVQSAAKASR